MSYLEESRSLARAWDAARDRSRQAEVGWSGVGGCRSWIGYKVRGEWPTDDEENWRAMVGTAMHEWWAVVRGQACHDAGVDVNHELPVSYKGIPGHVDEVLWETAEVTDWKYPRLASAKVWDDPEVLDEKFIQVQGYCAAILAERSKYALGPAWRKPTVRMLVMPVDGEFADWRVYERPFDRSVADRAVLSYRQVLNDADGVLPKDKPLYFCERFCEFFSACRGEYKVGRELEEITDPVIAAAIERYGQASEAYHEADRTRRELYPLIQGVRGKARGWKAVPGRPGAGKLVTDEDAVAKFFAREGIPMPTRTAPGRPGSVRIMKDE